MPPFSAEKAIETVAFGRHSNQNVQHFVPVILHISSFGQKKAEDLTPYLNILEDYGYCRQQEMTNGKRTFTEYSVNPALFETVQEEV